MANSIDPDETTCYNLHGLQRYLCWDQMVNHVFDSRMDISGNHGSTWDVWGQGGGVSGVGLGHWYGMFTSFWTNCGQQMTN